jgi:excisionase family DNA binding protein
MQSFLLSIQQMASKLGVHPRTLRRWERQGKMPKPERTIGKHRRYRMVPKADQPLTVGYVRVSSHDQKADLERQKAYVENRAGKPVDLIISDLGSGLNYKKAGFRRLLLLILQGKVRELILTHKDRPLRFGREIIFQICQFFGVRIIILNDEPDKPSMERFCTDLVEIMTVFCSKIYGHRSHQHRKCSSSSKLPAAVA